MYLHISTGTFFLSMESNVSAPSAYPGIPCGNLPNSVEYSVSYNLRYFGFFITWRYSISSKFSSFKTALLISIGNFRPAIFLGGTFSCILSAHAEWLLGIQCECRSWFCVQTRRLAMFLLLPVLLDLLVLLNVGVVPPLEVLQGFLVGMIRVG